jgi:glycosyltransferase involved in cell wall biosynthesis
MKNTVTLIVPTLNEIDGIRKIMPQIDKEWVDEIIIIDGGSTDGTVEYAKENGYFIISQKTQGPGNAIREAIALASGNIIIPFSPDGNSLPEAIPQLIEKMNGGYDMVIASRYTGGARSYDDDLVTRFGNWMFTRMVNLLFRARYTDVLVMLRAYKKNIVSRLKIEGNINTVFELLLCIRCAKEKLQCADIPADEPVRIGGDRKMKPLVNGTQLLLAIVREFLLNRRRGSSL